MFLTLLNKANCPKSQAKIACVNRKLHALCISSIAIPEQKTRDEKYARIRVFSNPHFLVYRKYE